jgi:hypothetical protein
MEETVWTIGFGMRIIPFSANVTPPIGTMLSYHPMRGVANPLMGKGVMLQGDFEPIVLVSLDWLGIAGSGHERLVERLAEAAGTSPDRVELHTVHQHDAPRIDIETANRVKAAGLPCHYLGMEMVEWLADNLVQSIKMNAGNPFEVTHIGSGRAKVREVASTRRVMGPDGMVKHVRLSSCLDPEVRAAPEGTIDPYLRLISFWNGDEALLGLSYYATHPQSYYGTGLADADFPGIARQHADLNHGVSHIYFTGAAGNVAAGKYNDRSKAARYRLVERMTEGYREAWEGTERIPIEDSAVGWKCTSIEIPLAEHILDEKRLEAVASEEGRPELERVFALRHLALLDDLKRKRAEAFSCLELGPIAVVHGPAELFVEYQLYAQSLRPDSMVAFAAYGEGRFAYIGLARTREEGGYEGEERVRRMGDDAEAVIKGAIRELLRGPDGAEAPGS